MTIIVKDVQEWINDLAIESLNLINQPLPDLTNEELDRVSKLETNIKKIVILSSNGDC